METEFKNLNQKFGKHLINFMFNDLSGYRQVRETVTFTEVVESLCEMT